MFTIIKHQENEIKKNEMSYDHTLNSEDVKTEN